MPRPESQLRSLIRDAQGPQPLTNIFLNQSGFPPLGPPLGVPSFGMPLSITSSRSNLTSASVSFADDMPPLETPSCSSSNSSDPDSDSPTVASQPAQPFERPNTRSRKRKAMEARKPPPANMKADDDDDRKLPAARLKSDDAGESNDDDGNCIICLCEPEPENLAKINGCDHRFCFECIEKWSERENTCPLCKVRFTKIDRVNKVKKQKTDDSAKKNSKKVKNRDQRADLHPGQALEGLLGKFEVVLLISEVFTIISFVGFQLDLVQQQCFHHKLLG